MEGWRCPVCHAENPAGTRFCGGCGETRAGADGSFWSCDACSAANVEGARFCGHCGNPKVDAAARTDERRLVTALFADISGFTTLADQLDDPEALHDVIEPVISGMAAVAERYEGFIAKYAGDALLVFFGAPVAHEDDATRALLVALEMHEALPRLLAELPETARGLQLHIGVNTGRVISGQFGGDLRNDYSILGDSVILAQRLESVAPSGSTYVGDTTRELTAELFRFEDVGELQLKGKLKPVRGWRLLGRATTPAGTAIDLGPLIGRSEELAVIDELLDGLERRRGAGAVSLVGEPGVGKSRLLAEARRRAEGRGIQWLQARCLAYGAALPYWPFAELIRTMAGIDPGQRPEDARRQLEAMPGVTQSDLPFLAEVVGASVEPGELGGLDPEDHRMRIHEAVTDWLLAVADNRPAVLTIEDVHWMDRASTALVAHIARVTHGWPLALVLTGRQEAEAVLDELLTSVDAAWRAHFLLGPLDHDAIVVYLATLLNQARPEPMVDSEPPPALVKVVEARTGGNPLFVGELVRGLLDEKALTVRNGRWRMRSGWSAATVPDTVERVLASRIDLLPHEAASLLSTASVIGRLVRVPLLREIAGDDELSVRLDELVEAGFLNRAVDGHEPAFVFHHALVQDVAYERLLRRHRRDLHRRVAEIAAGLYGEGDDVIELLARHAYLGELGAQAVDWLTRAGERARRLFANDEALNHLERAVETAASAVPERADGIRLLLGDLRNVMGDYDGALEAYRSIPEGPSRAAGEADVLRQLGEYDAALEVIAGALRRSTPPDAAATLLHHRGRILLLQGHAGEAVESLERALAKTDEGDPVVGKILVLLARANAYQGEGEAALDWAREALACFERTGDQRGLASAWLAIGDAHQELGQLDEAGAALRRSLQLAERTGQAEDRAGILLNLGLIELDRGDAVAAVDIDRRAVAEFERLDHPSGTANAHGNLAEALLHAGDLETAEVHARRAIAGAEAIGDVHVSADATTTLALVCEQLGRLAEAGDLAASAAERFDEVGLAEPAAHAREIAARARSTSGAPQAPGAGPLLDARR